ncbi:hypothetical protein GCM10010329_86730 [Streptomyces spiroverticillatus]|nr:hypothetical protein GCM10010329_86730 [Streptomyces spiroverticillatus]
MFRECWNLIFKDTGTATATKLVDSAFENCTTTRSDGSTPSTTPADHGGPSGKIEANRRLLIVSE